MTQGDRFDCCKPVVVRDVAAVAIVERTGGYSWVGDPGNVRKMDGSLEGIVYIHYDLNYLHFLLAASNAR